MYLQGNVSPVTEFVTVARLMNPKKNAVRPPPGGRPNPDFARKLLISRSLSAALNSISLKISDLPKKVCGGRILSVTDTIVEALREGKQA
jgi:hypothetical protein